MKYNFDEDKKELFCALVVIDAIDDKGVHFVSNLLTIDQQRLSSVFNRMIDKGLLTTNDDHEYIPTDKGYELIDNFYQRYQEFMKLYDLYCAVDLEAGEFAFSKILDMSEDEFQDYLNDDRWDDVRVAVCEFKKIDPMQMVFLSFLKEGRIDTTVTGWEVDLIDGTIWDEISEICNTAITSEQLSFEDQLKNIVIAGSELLKTLIQKEQEEEKNNPEEEVTETVTTTEETTEEVVDDYDDMVYYDPYFYDPYYVSPCWGFYYGTPYYW